MRDWNRPSNWPKLVEEILILTSTTCSLPNKRFSAGRFIDGINRKVNLERRLKGDSHVIGITLFCYPHLIMLCHVEFLSLVTKHYRLEMTKQWYSRDIKVFLNLEKEKCWGEAWVRCAMCMLFILWHEGLSLSWVMNLFL